MARTKRGIEYEPVGLHEQTWVIPHAEEGGESVIRWQSAPVPEVGRTGLQPEELLEIVAERLRGLNAALPSRETSLAITHIETAILWLEERSRDRKARGVEGTHAP